MDYSSRFKKLNPAQQAAVTTIEGPLMVVAGPGTGKTELLSMRTAHILKTTDTLPNNILCLTFTESGASAMRQRLSEIIGKDAYKVAIHTFHGFGSEIINRYPEYFYKGAAFTPASEIRQHEILASIFSELPHDSPLSGVMNDKHTYQSDTLQTISELKRSGLTSDELLNVLHANEIVLDKVESKFSTLFAAKISKKTKDTLEPMAHTIANIPRTQLPPGITPLQEVLALSLAHACDSATDTDSTKPITSWRNQWFEKNNAGQFVFKDRKRIAKLRTVAFIYYGYLNEMQQAQLYDFDDMVLNVLHALEVIDELRYTLQEQYLYIMVDEFQDTNLAQSRILASLTNNPANEGAPNIMVVGDDDQAIYSFQGAEISNILEFKDRYETTAIVTLTENYRSTSEILEHSRRVIALGSERLERYLPELNKTLNSHIAAKGAVHLHEFETISQERSWLADDIDKKIKKGIDPASITIIARRHHELVSLLPYLQERSVDVNYERRENVMDIDSVRHVILLSRFVHWIASNEPEQADALLPEILSHPAWNIPPSKLWQLSLRARQSRTSWLEAMKIDEDLSQISDWLITSAYTSLQCPLEPMIDNLLGVHASVDSNFVSPLFNYYFSAGALAQDAEAYITHLNAFRTLRDRVREHCNQAQLKLDDFIAFLDLQDSLDTHIVSVHGSSTANTGRINLMTAHKSKGLEFEHVYIHGAIDSSWGERVRTKSRLISYPSNLPLTSAGDFYDERLRLMYVALTRAKTELSISYSTKNDSGANTLPASFLVGDTWSPTKHEIEPTDATLLRSTELAWHAPLTNTSGDLKQLLTPLLDSYKLSATHLNTFLDVSRGGPQTFLLQNLLRFPQSMSANAAYGSAIHATLQTTHNHFKATGRQRPIEDILHDFDSRLAQMNLHPIDYEQYTKRGSDHLQKFFDQMYKTFSTSQQTELGFGNQQVILGNARLTGSLDLVDINQQEKTIVITDYKTGKPSQDWKGKTDHEKIKLHKYRQQLMFYSLLVNNSRDYAQYSVTDSVLQYVESTSDGTITALHASFTRDELTEFSHLINAVWNCITSLDLPDISRYELNYKGVLQFERDLLDHSK